MKKNLYHVYINGEVQFETFDKQHALFKFESYLSEFKGDKVELVQVLKSTDINEIMSKNKNIDTDGKYTLL